MKKTSRALIVLGLITTAMTMLPSFAGAHWIEGPKSTFASSADLLCTSGCENHGDQVGFWQSILWADQNLSCSNNSVDGIFGSQTDADTKSWQSSWGLTADGKAGYNSWTKAANWIYLDYVEDSTGSASHHYLGSRANFNIWETHPSSPEEDYWLFQPPHKPSGYSSAPACAGSCSTHWDGYFSSNHPGISFAAGCASYPYASQGGGNPAGGGGCVGPSVTAIIVPKVDPPSLDSYSASNQVGLPAEVKPVPIEGTNNTAIQRLIVC